MSAYPAVPEPARQPSESALDNVALPIPPDQRGFPSHAGPAPPPPPQDAAMNTGVKSRVAPYKGRRSETVLEKIFCSCCSLALRVIICASSASFLFGFNISLLNTSLNIIGAEYGWCDLQADTGCNRASLFKAFLSTSVFIGAAAGSMTTGRFLSIGRRALTLLNMVVFVVGISFSVASNSFTALLLARLVVGYGVGIVSVAVPTYMSEMSPKEKRGSYGVFHQLFITIGIFIAVLLGLPLSSIPGDDELEYTTFAISTFDKIWWRVMLGFGLVPVLLVAYLLIVAFPFETPYFYVDNGDLDSARILLGELRGKSNNEEELNEIAKASQDARDMEEAGMDFKSAFGVPVYRYVILVGCLLSAFQQFGGINVFMASSNALFSDAGLDRKVVTTMSTVLTLVNMLMTFPSIYLIEKMGRRSLMLGGSIGMAACVIPGALCLWIDRDAEWAAWVACGGAIGFIVFFAMSYGPVLWVYLFEIYPAEIRSVAAALATAVNWIAGIAMVFVSGFVDTRVNYTIFSVMSIIAVFIVFFFLRETKGRSLDASPYMVDKYGNPIQVQRPH